VRLLRIDGKCASVVRYGSEVAIQIRASKETRAGILQGKEVVLYPAHEDPVTEYLRELREELEACGKLGTHKAFDCETHIRTDDDGWTVYGLTELAPGPDPLAAARALRAKLEPEQKKPVAEVGAVERRVAMNEKLSHELATEAEFIRNGGEAPTAGQVETWAARAEVLEAALADASAVRDRVREQVRQARESVALLEDYVEKCERLAQKQEAEGWPQYAIDLRDTKAKYEVRLEQAQREVARLCKLLGEEGGNDGEP